MSPEPRGEPDILCYTRVSDVRSESAASPCVYFCPDFFAIASIKELL